MIIVRGNRIILPEGERPAAIQISDGVIASVTILANGASDQESFAADEVFDAGDLVVSPGIVDTHVHVNEPGRTDWEGFDTITQAAAAGGVTTIVDMPLNSIPATTTVAALEAKRRAARNAVHVDVAFWGGVVPGNAGELDALVDAGVRGFKCFLSPSGVDEFHHVGEADLREALPILARRGVPLLVHAESPAILDAAAQSLTAADRRSPAEAVRYAAYLASRPPAAEVAAIELMVRLSREFNARVHIVHVACAEAVAVIQSAKAAGVAITAETCPHYLTFAADEIPDGATVFKCAPPIRESRHRDALWQGLDDGALDLVATDHSPAPPAMKPSGDFGRAWGGIASLELSLLAVWTGIRTRSQHNDRPETGSADLARWLSDAPARLAGLAGRKGRIAIGFDGDLVVWDPDADTTVDPLRLRQKHKLTPYAGRRLRGRVRMTFLRGERVWDIDRQVTARRGYLL